MAEWIREDPASGCRPCNLAAVLPLYRDALATGGYAQLAQEVEALAGREVQPEEVAGLLDAIKAQVSPTIRNELLALDCLAQREDGEE